MKVLIQIVSNASVSVDNKVVSSIENGYLLFVGIEKGDDDITIEKMANKIINIRINKDENDKTNLSIMQTGGKILSISQFTLCADTKQRRPSFDKAANKDEAIRLYNLFNNKLRDNGLDVKEGVFGAYMKVDLQNDGPFTIFLDSTNL